MFEVICIDVSGGAESILKQEKCYLVVLETKDCYFLDDMEGGWFKWRFKPKIVQVVEQSIEKIIK